MGYPKPIVLECVVGTCAGVYQNDDGSYVIVGKRENPDVLKEGSVGEDEAVVRLPAGLVNIIEAEGR